MRLNRRSFSFAGLTLAVLAVVFAACTDDPTSPGGPRPPEPPVVTPPEVPNDGMAIPCRANVVTQKVECGISGLGSDGVRGDIREVGGQHEYVELTSSNISVVDSAGGPAGDVNFSFDVQLQNIFGQPTDGRVNRMGTSDAAGTLDPAGIRICFIDLVGLPTGEVTVVGEDGDMICGGHANQPFYRYDTVLNPGEATGNKRWTLHLDPQVTQFNFFLYVSTPVPLPQGWVDIMDADSTPVDTISLPAGSETRLLATPRGFAGQAQGNKPVSWSSLDPALATVDADSGIVTAGGTPGTVTIRAATATAGQFGDVVVVITNPPAVPFEAITNVTVPVPAPGLKSNPAAPSAGTVVAENITTSNGGKVVTAADGGFTYVSRAGFSGADEFQYRVTQGATTFNLTAVVNVAPSNYWYVRQGGTGAGTDAAPLGSLANAQDSAGVGDTIFVLNAASDLSGPAVLENGQALVGQGIPESLTRTLNSVAVTVLAAGSSSSLNRADAGATVTVAQDNRLSGLVIKSTNGAAIQGTGIDSLTLSIVTVAATGPALDLTNGTIVTSGLIQLSSTNSAGAGLVLNDMHGTLAANGGSIANAAGPGVQVTGGTVNLTYPGTITATGVGVSVSNRAAGAVTLADSVIAGGAVTVQGITGGTVTFNKSVTATGGVRVTGTGAGGVSFLGAVRSTAEGVVVSSGTAGTVLFSGPLTLSGKGIRARGNSGGTISFTSTATISTADSAGVDLSDNTGATLSFPNGGLAITVSGGAGAGFRATGGGLLALDSAGTTVTTATGTALTLTGMNTGSAPVRFRSVSSNGAPSGISLSGLTGTGGVAVYGGTISSPTSHGVHLTTLGTVPVVLANLSVTGAGTGGNAGISTATVGSLSVTGVSVAANGGPALSLGNTTLTGSFSNLTSTASTTSALILNTVDGAVTAAAGTLSGATGTTVAVIGGSIDLSFPGAVSQANAAPLLTVTNAHTGDLSFTGAVQATAGTGLQFNDADGTYAFGATTTLNGGDAGVDVTTGSGGTFTFAAGSSISNPTTGPALNVAASAPTVTFAGSITNNAGRAVAVDGLTGGTVTVSGPVSGSGATATGIAVTNGTGGSVEFSGAKTLSTAGNDAVTLTGNAEAVAVGFTGGSLVLTTIAGRALNADAGGTLRVTGAGNTAATTAGVGVRILNTRIDGTGGVVFQSVNAAGGVSGIVLQNTNTGTFGVTGTGGAGTGGTIQNTTGPAVSLTSTAAATLNAMNLSAGTGAASPAISGSSFGTLTVNGDSLTANTGPALLLTTGTLNGTFSRVVGTLPASAIKGVVLSGVGGSFTVSGGRLAGGLDSVMVVRGGTVSANWSGRLAQNGVSSAPLLAVVGNHATGTLAFSDSLLATAGTGAQFNDADGTYTFGGGIYFNGGDAGVDITNGSSGTFDFANTSTVTSPSGTAFAVNGSSPGVTYRGSLTKANAGLLVDIAEQPSGTVTFQTNNLLATAGDGVRLSNADGTVNLVGSMTLAGGNAGIDILNGSSGIINVAPAAGASQNITNPSGTAVFISGGAPTVTMNLPVSTSASRPFEIENLTGGSVTVSGDFTSTGNGIRVQGNTGGTIAFNGAAKTLSTGSNTAVSLVSNTGATVNFGGGGLVITTTTGTGFNATGGGTVNVTGPGNTVNASGGVGVNIQNTTLSGTSAFQRVTTNGGANGIVLQNTGAGGFQVTGVAATGAGSGGTIQNTSGADGAVAGNGVYLENAQNVSLAYVNLSGHANHAIRGLNVTTFAMNRTRITGTNGTNVSGEGEGGVYFHGLFGSASITSSYIEGGALDNVHVVNTTGTLDRLVMSNDTIGHNGNSGNDGVFLQADGSAVFRATVQNSRFTGSRGDQTQMSVRGTSNTDFVYSGNTLTNNHPNKLAQNFGLAISSGGSGAGYNPTLTYAVNNNTMNDIGSTGISIGKGGVGAGSFTGTVNGNQIGTAGVANSGSAQGSAIVVDIVGAGSHNSTITNNTIRQFTNYGILAQSGNTTAGGGQGYLTLTIQGNNIAEPSPAAASALFPTSGIRVVTGTNSGDTSKNCVVIGGATAAQKNTVTNTGTNGGLDLRLFQRFTTILGVPGYAGANNDNTAMNNFLTSRNTLSTVSGTHNVASGGPGYSTSCPA